jgi:hypothetical protein
MLVLAFETNYFWNPSTHSLHLYEGSLFYYYPATFASQTLICAVIFEYREREDSNFDKSSFKGVENSVLKAHIWNSFSNSEQGFEFQIETKEVHYGRRHGSAVNEEY